MIAQLNGKIIEVDLETAIVDVHGVGYEFFASSNTLSSLEVGSLHSISIYTHVREDILQLFGFLNKIEKHLFLSLLKVNGIGPKMAIKILSGSTLDRTIEMIETSDVKGLSALPKVGKKTAEQMILTLKGKLVSDFENKMPKATAQFAGFNRTLPSARQEISSALIHLGFRPNDVEQVLATFDGEISVEDGIRRGLQELSSLT